MLKVFLAFNMVLIGGLYNIMSGIIIRIRDLIDAVVSRRLATLGGAPGVAPAAAPGDRR